MAGEQYSYDELVRNGVGATEPINAGRQEHAEINVFYSMLPLVLMVVIVAGLAYTLRRPIAKIANSVRHKWRTPIAMLFAFEACILCFAWVFEWRDRETERHMIGWPMLAAALWACFLVYRKK